MPTRVLLEGPEIGPLLAQVTAEYGSGVRVVSAEKVRSGGVGGFFSREHYELSVEVPDGTVAAPEAGIGYLDAPAGYPGEPVDHLLDLFERHEQPAGGPPAAQPGPGLAPPAAAPPAPAAQPAPPAPAAPAAQAAPSAPLGAPGSAFADVMAHLVEPGATARTGTEPPRVRPYRPPSIAAPAVPAGGAGTLVADLIRLGLPAPLAVRAGGADVYHGIRAALADLSEPPAPPRQAGDIMVLLGEADQALAVARVVAHALRLDPDAIMIAAPGVSGTGLGRQSRISGPVEAARRARELRLADVPHLVVVHAPVHERDTAWARAIVTELRANAVWTPVDATRRTADTARYLARLGRVDAIAGYGAAGSAEPAALLGLGVPAALLDGWPATAHVWASLLAAALTPAPDEPAGTWPWA